MKLARGPLIPLFWFYFYSIHGILNEFRPFWAPDGWLNSGEISRGCVVLSGNWLTLNYWLLIFFCHAIHTRSMFSFDFWATANWERTKNRGVNKRGCVALLFQKYENIPRYLDRSLLRVLLNAMKISDNLGPLCKCIYVCLSPLPPPCKKPPQ